MRYKALFIISFFAFQGAFAALSDIIGALTPCVSMKEECPTDKVTFWLYTRENMEMPHELIYNNIESLKTAPFVKNQPVFIVIHGYASSRETAPNLQLKPALLLKGDFNVIAVDYNSTVKSPCYLNAAKNVKVVANCTAQFLDFMLQSMGIPLEQVHVIGFSLGAHVAGLIANFIQSGKLNHITGLDPANPLFMTTNDDEKLDQSDAKFVDVIHTNALFDGKLEPSGHVDFYVNGGNMQPGCQNLNPLQYISCDHNRSPVYYAESINTKVGFYGRKFPRVSCPADEKNCDIMIMGFDTPHTARGIYTVETNKEEPFAMGMPQ